jgi:hypothetical protein
MSLTGRLEKVGTLVKAIAAMLALLPGIAMLLGLVDIPPSIVDLAKYVSLSVSIVVVLVVMLLSDSIRAWRAPAIAAVIGACAVIGAVLAVFYLTFTSDHVVVVGSGEQAVHHIVPLNPTEEVRRLVAPYGGDYLEALNTSVDRQQLADAMQKDRGSAVFIIIALLIAAQMFVISAIVLGAWKLTSGSAKRRRAES